jgi:branched-chain amino acid transport system substrate-binding protein
MHSRFLIVFVLLCLVSGCSRTPAPGSIVLGHLKPPQNDDESQGIALAIEQINGDPGRSVLGRRIKVIHADAGNTPDEAQGQTARLITIDKVDGLIGTNRWPQTEKMAFAAQSPPTPAFSLNGYAGLPACYVLFPVAMAPSERGRALARYAKENLKLKRAIVLKESDSGVPGIVAKAFVENFPESLEHTIKGGNLPASLGAMAANKGVMVLCASADKVLAWQAKLPDLPLLFGGEEGDVAALEREGNFDSPIVAAVSFHPTDETPAAKEFVRAYSEKYGKPPSISSVLAHDAVSVWSEGARRANSLQMDKLHAQFLKADASFDVLTGKLTYDANHAPKRPIFIVEIRGNQTEKLVRFEP